MTKDNMKIMRGRIKRGLMASTDPAFRKHWIDELRVLERKMRDAGIRLRYTDVRKAIWSNP